MFCVWLFLLLLKKNLLLTPATSFGYSSRSANRPFLFMTPDLGCVWKATNDSLNLASRLTFGFAPDKRRHGALYETTAIVVPDKIVKAPRCMKNAFAANVPGRIKKLDHYYSMSRIHLNHRPSCHIPSSGQQLSFRFPARSLSYLCNNQCFYDYRNVQ